jgi:alkylation response protein AidB-like acyl-CoA dehydrogenase
MSTPNLLYTEIEDDLRASVTDLLTDRCAADAVLQRCESDRPLDLELWRELAGLGATALHVPEEVGGEGATLRETAVVAEELGRFVAPVPFLGATALGTTTLLACARTDTVADLLKALAGGASIGVLAVPLSACAADRFPATVRAEANGLTGSIGTVADAGVADILLVPAHGPDGPELHAVRVQTPPDEHTVSRAPVVSLDLTRPVTDLEFSCARSEPVAVGDAAVSAVERAGLVGLSEGQKIEFEEQRDPKRGKSSAVNLKKV